MELRNLTQFPTDYLDAYCDAQLGHTNWSFVAQEDIGNDKIYSCVVFFNEPEEEYE